MKQKIPFCVVATLEGGYSVSFRDVPAFVGEIGEQEIAAAAGLVHEASCDGEAVVEKERSVQFSNTVNGARIVARYRNKYAGSWMRVHVVIGDTQRQASQVAKLLWRRNRR